MESQRAWDLHESAGGLESQREKKDIDMQMIVLNFIERLHLS